MGACTRIAPCASTRSSAACRSGTSRANRTFPAHASADLDPVYGLRLRFIEDLEGGLAELRQHRPPAIVGPDLGRFDSEAGTVKREQLLVISGSEGHPQLQNRFPVQWNHGSARALRVVGLMPAGQSATPASTRSTAARTARSPIMKVWPTGARTG